MNKEIFTYTGKVTIRRRTRAGNVYEVETSNHGTDRLFRGLCYALCGNEFEQYKPKNIIFAKSGDEGSTFTSIMSGESNAVGTVDLSGQTPKAKFTCSISAYQINQITLENNEHIYLCLLCDKKVSSDVNSRVLAYLQMTDDSIKNGIAAGTVLGIEWGMSFSNTQ